MIQNFQILKAEREETLSLNVYGDYFSPKSHKIAFVGFKKLNFTFNDNSFLVYQLQIKSNEPIENVIYKTNKTKRLGQHIDALEQKILVDLTDFEDSDAQLYLFGRLRTEVEIKLELNLLSSFIKVSEFYGVLKMSQF